MTAGTSGPRTAAIRTLHERCSNWQRHHARLGDEPAGAGICSSTLCQRTTLFDSIFVCDDQMLGEISTPTASTATWRLLHLRRAEGGGFFAMYLASFQRVWEPPAPLQDLGAGNRARPRSARSLGHASHAGRYVTALTSALVSTRSGRTASAPSARRRSILSCPVAIPITYAPPRGRPGHREACPRSALCSMHPAPPPTWR